MCHQNTWCSYRILPATHVCTQAQSCPTLCGSMDASPPGSSVHGIFQAGILNRVAIKPVSLIHLLHWQVGCSLLMPPECNWPNETVIPRDGLFPTISPHSGSLRWWTVGASVNSCRWAFGQLTNYRKPGTNHTLICWSGGLICDFLEVVLQSQIQQCEVWWAWEKGVCQSVSLGSPAHCLNPWHLLQYYCTSPISGCDPKIRVHPRGKEVWTLWPAWRRQEVLLFLNDFILTCHGRMLPNPRWHGALRLRECHQRLRLFLLFFPGKTQGWGAGGLGSSSATNVPGD